MKPEDIIDGLGYVSDRMVLDAQKLGKRPRAGLKWISLAACLLCGVLLLGVSAAKLWNREGRESLSPSPTPAVSAPVTTPDPVPDSAREEPIVTEDETSPIDSTAVMDYQVKVTADRVYFADPYAGLISMEPDTHETKVILETGDCSLIQSEGEIYCLSQADRTLYQVQGDTVSAMMVLGEAGSGWPQLMGVSDGYVCWRQDGNLYVASMDSGEPLYFRPLDEESSELWPCGVYGGYVYGVNMTGGSLRRMRLATGEVEILWAPEEGDPTEYEQVLRMTGTTVTGAIAGVDTQNLYLEAVQTIGDTRHFVFYCLDMSTGELRELTTLDDGYVTMGAWDGKLYLMHTVGLSVDGQTTTVISCDGATGETTALLEEADASAFTSLSAWTLGPGHIYVTQVESSGAEGGSGLFDYDLTAKSAVKCYETTAIYGTAQLRPAPYWSEAGDITEDFNESHEYYDLTPTAEGLYLVDPTAGVYRYNWEMTDRDLVVQGIGCRILSTEDGVYITCSNTGAVYRLEDGMAQYLLALSKDDGVAVEPVALLDGKLYWNWYATDLTTGDTQEVPALRMKLARFQGTHQGRIYFLSASGAMGYVDPASSQTYTLLDTGTDAVAHYEAALFGPDDILAAERDRQNNFTIYKVDYDTGARTALGSTEGETLMLLGIENGSLYWAQKRDYSVETIQRMDLDTGEMETVLGGQAVVRTALDTAAEIAVWEGNLYYVAWKISASNVIRLEKLELPAGIHTVYNPALPSQDTDASENSAPIE